jgi:hypothetical protein
VCDSGKGVSKKRLEDAEARDKTKKKKKKKRKNSSETRDSIYLTSTRTSILPEFWRTGLPSLENVTLSGRALSPSRGEMRYSIDLKAYCSV